MLNLYYYILLAQILLISVLFIYNQSRIVKPFRQVSGRTWFILLMILLFALCVRTAMCGYDNFDLAWTHIFTARELMVSGSFGSTATIIGYPAVISILYYVFGYTFWIAPWFSTILGSLTPVLGFCLSWLLLKDEHASLFTAIVFACMPANIFFSGMSLPITLSLFSALMGLTLFLISLRGDSQWMYALSLLVIGFSATVRVENVIYLLLPLSTFLFYRRPDTRKLVLPLMLIALFSFPLLFWYANAEAIWGRGSSSLSMSLPSDTTILSQENLQRNIGTYAALTFSFPVVQGFSYNSWIPMLMFLFVAPSVLCYRERRFLFLILWAVLVFSAYTFSYQGMIEPLKYSVMFYTPLVLLSGFGFLMVKNFFREHLPDSQQRFVFLALLIIPVFLFFSPSQIVFPNHPAQTDSVVPIISACQNLEPGSCILVQKDRNNFTVKERMQLLLPDMDIRAWPGESMDNCTDSYYINTTFLLRFVPTIYAQEVRLLDKLSQEFRIELVFSKDYVEVYKLDNAAKTLYK